MTNPLAPTLTGNNAAPTPTVVGLPVPQVAGKVRPDGNGFVFTPGAAANELVLTVTPIANGGIEAIDTLAVTYTTNVDGSLTVSTAGGCKTKSGGAIC